MSQEKKCRKCGSLYPKELEKCPNDGVELDLYFDLSPEDHMKILDDLDELRAPDAKGHG